ncbi:MAG: LacI family DNA-binding transcriptional regulator [Propionivibrio sp.]
MPASLNDIAKLAGVSVKTVSGALHGGNARMSEQTRQKIKEIADSLGYVTNLAARSMKQGYLPLIAVVADELSTSPIGSEIIRGLDNEVRKADMALFVTPLGRERDLGAVIAEVARFRPWAIAYLAMYHKVVDLPPGVRESIGVLINCRERSDSVVSLVPDEVLAAREITDVLIRAGRRKIAFLNLPGILAGELRRQGFVSSLREHELAVREDWILPAVRHAFYADRAHSLVREHVTQLMSGSERPDAILCGNDRVAMEVYAALRRLGVDIPKDVAVASFDNQIDIAARLDPPLTTMALPHRAMGRMAGEILLAEPNQRHTSRRLPFHLVERESV